MIESPRIVLVVEDVPNIVNIIKRALNGTLTQVASAFDGETGLEKARQMRPDLILLDLGLPGITGWGVISTLREEGLHMPVVVVTASDDPETARRAAEAGVAELLGKPFDPAELRSIVARYAFPESSPI